MAKNAKKLKIVSSLLYPAQLPVFAIENFVSLVNKKRWQLPPILSSIYFFIVSFLSSFIIVYWGGDIFNSETQVSFVVKFLTVFTYFYSLYYLTVILIGCVWYSYNVSMGKGGESLKFFLKVCKRLWKAPRNQLLFNGLNLYLSFFTYFYVIIYYSVFNIFLFYMDSDSFKKTGSAIVNFNYWDFLFYSASTITTLGYSEIKPTGFVSQVSSLSELYIGMFIIIFVFGNFISFYMNKVLSEE